MAYQQSAPAQFPPALLKVFAIILVVTGGLLAFWFHAG